MSICNQGLCFQYFTLLEQPKQFSEVFIYLKPGLTVAAAAVNIK